MFDDIPISTIKLRDVGLNSIYSVIYMWQNTKNNWED